MLRERVADLLAGAVPVVGERLDQQRHAARRVPLVLELLVASAVRQLAGPALDRAVDVVVRDGEALRLLHRRRERHVAVDVAAAFARRDLDRAQELGVHARPLGVGGLLLAFDRRPLGVPGHVVTPSSGSSRGARSRGPAPGGRMPRAGCPAPARPDAPRASARTRTSAPRSSTLGARMNTPRTGMIDALHVQVGLERIHLPPVGVAAHRDVDEVEQRLAALHAPGEHDHAGARAEDRHARRRALPDRLDQTRPRARACRSWWTRRRGSPGSRPRRAARRVRTSTGVAPTSASTRTCSRKSPWSASTPAFTGTPGPTNRGSGADPPRRSP